MNALCFVRGMHANASDLDFANAVHVDEATRDDLVAVMRVTVAQIEVVD